MNGESAEWHRFLQQHKWLLVKIWAADCVICNETVHEIVDLQRQRGQHGTDDLVVVGIALSNNDDLDAINRYIERNHLNFQNLLDDGKNIAQIFYDGTGEKWGGWTPTFLLYNPQGKLAAKNIGPVSATDITHFIEDLSD